jgi:hypothetical protein
MEGSKGDFAKYILRNADRGIEINVREQSKVTMNGYAKVNSNT